MNEIIERAKLHFNENETRVILVPEWGADDKPLEIFCRPFNLAQKNKLFKKSGGDVSSMDLTVMADCLIMKAEDGQGNKMFTLESKRDLMNAVDPDVVSRIAAEMLQGVTQEEMEEK